MLQAEPLGAHLYITQGESHVPLSQVRFALCVVPNVIGAQPALAGGRHLQGLPLRRRRGEQQEKQEHREPSHGFAPSIWNAMSTPPERSST